MTGHRRMNAFPVDGWRSANRCGPDGGNCVEVNLGGVDDDVVGIRDSKSGAGSVLVFRSAQWRSFLLATIMDNIGD